MSDYDHIVHETIDNLLEAKQRKQPYQTTFKLPDGRKLENMDCVLLIHEIYKPYVDSEYIQRALDHAMSQWQKQKDNATCTFQLFDPTNAGFGGFVLGTVTRIKPPGYWELCKELQDFINDEKKIIVLDWLKRKRLESEDSEQE